MKDDKVYLISILESIENIEDFTKNGEEEVLITKIIQHAVIRNLEVIGEVSKKISNELRKDFSEIPWREMAVLRDVLIHDYLGVDNLRGNGIFCSEKIRNCNSKGYKDYAWAASQLSSRDD